MIYSISNGDSTASCSNKGGEITSFSNGKTEYVWNGDGRYWFGHTPVLFPCVCSPLNGMVRYNGEEFYMPKHGFLRNARFKTTELGPDFITFTHKWDEESLNKYPGKYTLNVTHSAFPDGFSTTFEVIAENDMVFNLGGHPGFMCPLEEGYGFSDYDIVFSNARGAVVSITEEGYMDDSLPKVDCIKNNRISLDYSLFDNDALIVENLRKKELKLVNRVTGHGFKFDFSDFDAIGIWTPERKEAPLICLEPWCGLPANVNENGDAEEKKYSISLKEGETFSATYSIKII